MNKRKLWTLIAVPGLAATSLLLAFLLLGWNTVGAASDGAAAIIDIRSQDATIEAAGLITDVEIFKSVDELFAVQGERRTYQMVMSPEQDIATARLTDTLPSAVTWAGGLSATSGNANYSNGSLTWSGSLTSGVPVTITYGVSVTHAPCFGTAAYTDIYTDVHNDAILDDGQGNISYSTPAVFAIGRPFGTGSDRTFAVEFGDADNDGDLDLAVGNHGPNQICWNNGEGIFECENEFGGSPTFDMDWGDMNGDGYLDLVVANPMAHPNLVCLNNKDRTFNCSAFSYCAGPGRDEVCFVALGDVDCDDDVDIALGTRFPGNVWAEDIIYYNNGDATFPITDTTCQGHPTMELDFGDVDNDGDLDLAVVGHYSEYVCINANNCTGTFTETRWLAASLNKNTQSVALSDTNKDGYLDVAVGRESYSNEVYLNDGLNNPGYFTNKLPFDSAWKTWDVAWGDVDGDGDLDLASGNTYPPTVVYFNDPVIATDSITFAKQVFLGTYLSHRTLSVAFGDVDGDGDLDLATGNDGEQNVVYLNSLTRPVADFTFTTSQTCGTPPLTVVFTNISTCGHTDLWDFGDGITSTLKSPTHTYTAAGVYTVTLTVSGPGGTDTATKTAYIKVYHSICLPIILKD